MQDVQKAVWSIAYVSVAFFPSLKHNFIAYCSKVSSRPDCNFEIHHLWQSGFSRVYSNYCCSCSFEAESIKIGQSSHKMYSNNILNFQESTTILNAHMKKVWKLIVCPSYEIVLSRIECSLLIRIWVSRLEFLPFFSKLDLYTNAGNLWLPTSSLVEEFQIGKVHLHILMRDSANYFQTKGTSRYKNLVQSQLKKQNPTSKQMSWVGQHKPKVLL